MRRRHITLLVTLPLALAACDPGTPAGQDAGRHVDAGIVVDAGIRLDGGTDDAGTALDAGTDDAAAADAATDEDAGDGGPACGARVEPYAHVRPFGASAPWNTPVCGLPRWSRSDEFRDRFWRYSYPGADPANPDVGRGRHDVDFGLGADPTTDFAPPVYFVADATTTRTVRLRRGWGRTNLAYTDTIPWNPAWRAMGGSDGVMIILDPATGREWDLWGVVQHDALGLYNDSECWFADGGYSVGRDLCVGSAFLVTDPAGAPIDHRTYTGNFPSRGVQIEFYAMVVTPDEVREGEIRHALMMGVANTMFGPSCTPAELDTPAAGTTCGFAVAPAGGLEWEGRCTSCPPSPLDDLTLRSRSIPEGMRLALDLTDGEIDAWLDARGYTGALRRTARIFAVALRDYGWFITDTAGTATFAVSGSANPATRDAWRSLGIAGDGADLLRGLISRERLWVAAPATNECADGPSTRACRAGASHY